MIVLDASATVEVLFNTKRGERVSGRLGDEAIHCPELMPVEAIQAIRRYLAQA